MNAIDYVILFVLLPLFIGGAYSFIGAIWGLFFTAKRKGRD